MLVLHELIGSFGADVAFVDGEPKMIVDLWKL